MFKYLLSTMIAMTTLISAHYDEFGTEVGHNTYQKNEDGITKITYLVLDDEQPPHATMASHFWSTFKWPNPTGNLVLNIGDCHTSGTEDWTLMLTDVVDKWNNVPQYQDGFGETYTATNVVFQKTDCTSGMIKSYNDNYGATGWIGLASIWLDSNKLITRATSKVNEYYSPNTAQWQHVMCQEIGHGFPLGHTSTDGSDQDTCMDYASGLNNKYPNAHDIEMLDILYGPSQPTPSPTPSPTKKPRGGKGGGKGRKKRFSDSDEGNKVKQFFEDYWQEMVISSVICSMFSMVFIVILCCMCCERTSEPEQRRRDINIV